MNFDVRKRKSWKEDEGVSEIVGNILILMITVILFSGIMAFVQQMPVPEQATKVDFSASVSFSPSGSTANLTVTHAGGAVMNTRDVFVLIDVDSVNSRYNMSDPDHGLKDVTQWTTGQSWTVALTDTTYTSTITVTIVDNVKHSAIWTSQVTGGHGGNPPNILQRYVDSNPATSSADPVKEFDDFTFYATITDPDGDLNISTGIWIDTSQITTSTTLEFVNSHWTPDNSNGDVYSWDFSDVNGSGVRASDLDGAVFIIHAWDEANHQSISTFVMNVIVLPVEPGDVIYNPLEPGTEPSGDSFLPAYIRWFYDNQGFGIFAERFVNGSATGKADTSEIEVNYTKDHWVFVRFASKVMSNTFVENSLILLDIRTNLAMTPRFNETAGSTATKPFYPMVGNSGGIYIYEAQFNTSPLPPGAYDLQISLKNQPSSGQAPSTYGGHQTIVVSDPNSPIQFYPEIALYKDAAYSVPWGDRYHPYQISSSDAYKVYVTVSVQDTDNPPSPTVTEVRMTDGAKNSEIFGVPPAGNMISRMGRLDATHYNFSIDLRLNNGVQWRGGNNSYTLLISKLNDTNEGMYSLSEQVFIVGAGSRADFFVGTTGMASGNSNFNTREYAFFIQNNNLFTARILWQSESTPGSSTDYTVTAMGVGDIDGDGDRDLLMGQAASNQLYLFENTLNIFGTWQSGSTISRPDGLTYRVTWIAFGDVNGDGHDDFAYSNSNAQIVIYNTTYGSKGWIYTPPTGKGWTSPVAKISLTDMTGDGRADLIVLANTKISIYDLKYTYDPLLKAQEIAKGRVAVSVGTTVDFDLEDMDNDSMVDILTAGTIYPFTGGVNGVNVNYYTTAAGNKKVLDEAAQNYNPLMSAGDHSNGTVDNTYAADSTTMSFRENGTLNPSDPGRVIATMKFLQLTDNPDQQLRVYARVQAINHAPDEVFYAWYSTDNVAYIPVMTISSASWQFYNYSLPSSVMNKAIYLRFTDSLTSNSSGDIVSFLQVNMAAVFTDTFGGYSGKSVAADTTWTCVRAAAIDGPFTATDNHKEVVVAKHHDSVATSSLWKVYRYTTGPNWVLLSGEAPGNISFFVSSSAKVGTGYFSNLAPTLFRAADINGDGLTDIMVVNYTTTGGTDNSYIGFYMNLWTGSSQYYRYFSVRAWTIDPPTGQAKDPWIDIAIVANLTVV